MDDLKKSGFRCPCCSSSNLRAGYHDWQTLDSFICEECGLRWMEDVGSLRDVFKIARDPSKFKKRNIWILHSADHVNKPLKNPKSADEVSRDKFYEEAYPENINPSKR